MWRESFGLLEKSYVSGAPASFLLGKDLHIPLCPVPLCSAVVDVAIQDYVADVASELIYQNKSRTSSEVIFVFPLAPHMTIYSFQALNEDAKVQALLQDETQQLHKATKGQENWEYLQHQSEHSGEVFACFLGSLSPGKEMVVTLRYVQELPRKLGGAAQFLLPATLHPHWNYYTWNCHNNKPYYSLLLTASLQSPRGVVNAEANCALTPLIYTAQDHSAAQVSLAETPPRDDFELLVYYGDPTEVSAVVEKGDPGAPVGSLLGDPLVLVTLSPSIPDAMPGQCRSGEFIFLLDTTFLERAQESLLFLLKSLPLGCYFNIYCYGATSVGIYPQSVEYTQDNLTKAMQRIPSTSSCLGDADLLGTLRTIYNTPQPHGHARQLFIFMTGLPPDKEAIAAEVCHHRNSHRCFSFCFSEDSAALAMTLARETRGEATYVKSDKELAVVVLNCLKRALKPAAEGVSLSWTLPLGLEAEVLGGTPRSIFQGEHIHLYAKIRGEAQDMKVATGVLTLQFSLNGQNVAHTIPFPLCPQGDGRLAGHRLAARCLLGMLLADAVSGSGDEPRQRAVEISLTSGIICPFTSYVGVRTSQWVTWYQGPLALLPPHQSLVACQILQLRGSICSSSCFPKSIFIPPGWLTAVQESWFAIQRLTHDIAALAQNGAHSKAPKPPPPSIYSLESVDPNFVLSSQIFWPWVSKAIDECQELVALQNVDGSWTLSSSLASALQVDEAEIKGKMPGEVTEPSIWATVLAVTWLQKKNRYYQGLCELLEAKAVTWLCSRAASQLDKCLEAANTLLESSVELVAGKAAENLTDTSMVRSCSILLPE
ncbi:von Willebrand factor A domain-containing protein 5A-like isoform X1 [Anas platyrhynchos]|uniref:von Willebrand factor A domain-containing protein 5A-like isoform X1 n=2 Tax=Anas platyrhynchos TaxID=8839 RepID=UPI003AF2EB4E